MRYNTIKNTIIWILLMTVGMGIVGLDINANAQELLCNVRVQAPKLNKVDPAVFETFESEVTEFMNSRQWTDKSYAENEKIECNLNITITEEVSSTRFKAEITVQANRPVYNSNYQSLLFQHQDKDWEFSYTQYQPLEFDENAFINNLTSVLAFYAYMVIGYDNDSFAQEGGTNAFRLAESLVDKAQSQSFEGWKPNDNNKRRNRYWMVTNIMNPRFKTLRNIYYTYHRTGLDMMYEDPNTARKNILNALRDLEKSNRDNPNTMAVKVFSVSKNQEIIDLFNDAAVTQPDKVKVANIMTQVDPASSAKFSELLQMRNGANNAGWGRGNSGGNTVPARGK